MRTLLSFTLVLIGSLAIGQGSNRRYDAFGWGLAQTAYGVERLTDGYMVISGSGDFDSIAPGQYFFHYSVLLTRINLNGDRLWEKRSWRPGHSAFPGWANCCDSIPSDGFIVGGSSENTSGLGEVYLMRFDSNGDTLWTRVFGDPNGNNFWSGQQVKRTMDEGFLIVGYTGPIAATSWSGFAIRTDANGNEIWRSTYPWPGNQYTILTSCALAADGDLVMSGSRFPTSTNGDYWVQKTNGSGAVLWSVSWGGVFTDGIHQIISSSDGHMLACGATNYASGQTNMKPYLVKLDSSDGSIIWEREYGPQHYSHLFHSLSENPNGSVIAAGRYFEQPGPTSQKGLLALTSALGDSLWKYSYFYVDSIMSTGQGSFYDVIQANDGGFIAVGRVNNPVGQGNPPGYSQDTWVVKVDADGCIVPGCNNVGITEQATNLLGALSIWPNPARGQATVQLTLPPSVGNGPFELMFVATDGRVVRRERIAGNGAHTLALQELPAGMYYVHVADGGKWLTGAKLVVQ